MILRRLGNKSKLAEDLLQYFPPHKIYIEPFFGAGGMFFNKPKVKYNLMNDNDSDVFNLFNVLSNNRDELLSQLHKMPIHTDLLNHWKNNEETDDVKRALRFVFLSNFCLYGQPDTLRLGAHSSKQSFLKSVDKTCDMIFDVQFMNVDFRKVFKMFELKKPDVDKVFCYCDPPYLDTGNNYESGFTEEDSFDLFEMMNDSGVRWAMSEFDHPFILDQAKERGLNIIPISERTNLKNKRLEILITNYQNNPTLF